MANMSPPTVGMVQCPNCKQMWFKLVASMVHSCMRDDLDEHGRAIIQKAKKPIKADKHKYIPELPRSSLGLTTLLINMANANLRGMPRTSSTSSTGPYDLTAINLALGLDAYGNGEMSLNNPNNNMFPYLEQTGSSTNLAGMQRQAPSMGQHQGNNTNGGGGGAMNGMNVGMPMNAGQQMDFNMLYQKVMELSQVLQENREQTKGIVASAEELATRAAANGTKPSLEEANNEVTAARIADLERQLSSEKNKVRVLLREQRLNTGLIGEYETGMGQVVEMVRNYSYSIKESEIALRKHYNKLLQDEKDAHLQSRLEKDEWHAKTMRCVEMIRHAYRLRCEEDEVPIRIVAGLQTEVRAYRAALGMEKEKFEDEGGYEILKDVENGAGEP